MADIWDDDYEDQPTNESDLVKQLRAKIREDKKKYEELDKELKTLRPQVRKQSVSNILSNLKVNPKIAALIPQDIEANEEAIKGWVTEYGDLFNLGAPQGTEQNQEEQNQTSSVDPNTAQQWDRIQSQESQSGVSTPDKEAQDLAMLQAAADAAGGNSDLLFAYLKGELPIPVSGQTATA
jgi:hypothetical protein